MGSSRREEFGLAMSNLFDVLVADFDDPFEVDENPRAIKLGMGGDDPFADLRPGEAGALSGSSLAADNSSTTSPVFAGSGARAFFSDDGYFADLALLFANLGQRPAPAAPSPVSVPLPVPEPAGSGSPVTGIGVGLPPGPGTGPPGQLLPSFGVAGADPRLDLGADGIQVGLPRPPSNQDPVPPIGPSMGPGGGGGTDNVALPTFPADTPPVNEECDCL